MIKSNEAQHDYRFGDSGPKYLIRGPMCVSVNGAPY